MKLDREEVERLLAFSVGFSALPVEQPMLAELLRSYLAVLDAPVGELYCSCVKGTNDFALSDADGYPIDLKALEGSRVRLVRVQEGL